MTPSPESTLYFLYGWQLDARLLARYCPNARIVSAARLPGYALGFFGYTQKWDGAEEAVVASKDGAAWGLVVALNRADTQRLDDAQNVHGDGSGSYFHYPADVVGADGQPYEVLLYMKSSRGEPRPPSAEYRDLLAAGAEAHGLPADYVAQLRHIAAPPAGYPVPHGLKDLPMVAVDLDSPCHF
jgi:gamma-glutamylcyclotransferase